MRDPRREQLTVKRLTGQPSDNIVSLRRAQAPPVDQLEDLITSADAQRLFQGVTEKHLYKWVAEDLIRAYTTRFVKWTLYSRAEIEAVLSSFGSPTPPKPGPGNRDNPLARGPFRAT
jgi:hypothetical protein